jgi:hypothetical protein
MSTGFEQQAFQGENHEHASSQAFEVHLPRPLDIPASLELFRSNRNFITACRLSRDLIFFSLPIKHALIHMWSGA